jgi:hypothetical protein
MPRAINFIATCRSLIAMRHGKLRKARMQTFFFLFHFIASSKNAETDE